MPYNNTPITPSKDVTGTVSLPLARVKKIINVDPDVGNCSNNAAFVITVATEMFLQYLVQQSYVQVKAESAQKPRRNIQYRDIANAVTRVENLEFLTDVVPKSLTYKQAKQRVATKHLAATNKNPKVPFESAFYAAKEKPSDDAMEIVEGERETEPNSGDEPDDEEIST